MHAAGNTEHREKIVHLDFAEKFKVMYATSAVRHVDITMIGIADLILSAKLVCTN